MGIVEMLRQRPDSFPAVVLSLQESYLFDINYVKAVWLTSTPYRRKP